MNNQFDMACPECGATDELDIAATVWVRLTDDGTDADESHDGSHEWNDDSPCRCDACGWEGKVLNADADRESGKDDDPMGATYCDRCNNRLESGQIGLCNSCIDNKERGLR